MEQTWDCHVHCFDPARFPFKDSRSYTPVPATLDTLVRSVRSPNLVITQATIEDGVSGIQDALERAQMSPELNIVRGTIMASHLRDLDAQSFRELHAVGVRCVRIHGTHGGAGDDLDWITQQFRLAATSIGVRNYGWHISAQLPLQSWASLGPCLSELNHVTILVDHNASACPSDLDSPAFAAFLELLGVNNLVVKIGALHRRSLRDVEAMREVVQAFVAKASDRVLFGSDWPHVNASRGGAGPTPHVRDVDTATELSLLRTWVSEEQWNKIMSGNPDRLFAN
ncbi:unnamed protein product [Aureobasidium uvarum]|uniref:Amidohydrolase-related domain-containing protein n=1 Tax=Aureobasidium uvarum TaxID=2773716 RepID=A0A9N8KGS5_9PEZI|nr:unnamed protein product [Aureobasidium uvarum]